MPRYIITHKTAFEADKPAALSLVTFAAEIADSAADALAQFAAKHPDKIALSAERVTDEHDAFMRYGMGAWTDEEQADHRARMAHRYDRLRDEHDAAREIVGTYTPDEFAAEANYKTRRAEETTPNLDGVHVGDIFVACWGYDQTNYDFWQVVELRGKHTAVLRENACKAEMCSDYSGYKRPIRDAFTGDAYTVRTTSEDGVPMMRVPDLMGRHRMTPFEFGKLYQHSTGA